MDGNATERTWAERLLDQVFPDELDWKGKVMAYPVTALVVAAGFGFVLARSHGARLSSTIASLAANRVASTIADVLDTES